MELTKKETNAKLILCEPFNMSCPIDRANWREYIDPKIHIVRKLSKKYEALFMPFDGIFAKVTSYSDYETWIRYGVHPTITGYYMMADTWIREVIEK